VLATFTSGPAGLVTKDTARAEVYLSRPQKDRKMMTQGFRVRLSPRHRGPAWAEGEMMLAAPGGVLPPPLLNPWLKRHSSADQRRAGQ
jgi:hypothetical protein